MTMQKLTKTGVRNFLKKNFCTDNLTLADLVIYPETNYARAFMFSRNHVFYEIELSLVDGCIKETNEHLLVRFEKEMMKNA